MRTDSAKDPARGESGLKREVIIASCNRRALIRKYFPSHRKSALPLRESREHQRSPGDRCIDASMHRLNALKLARGFNLLIFNRENLHFRFSVTPDNLSLVIYAAESPACCESFIWQFS